MKKKNIDMEIILRERLDRIDPALWQALNKSKDSFAFRINRHRAERGKVLERLHKEGYYPKDVEWSKDVFTLPVSDRKRIVKSSVYTENLIYIQNLSSIYAAQSLDIESEDWVLDLAAAPGGKSLIFSEKAKKVSAVEPDKKRFFRMKRNFKEHLAKNIQTYNKDGRYIYKSCPQWFDAVFLDAPCSSEAHIDLAGEGVTWWNLRRVRRFSKLQKELIISAYESLKGGVHMVYATCTFSPEENEAVVNFLLKNYPNARLEPILCNLDNVRPGLPEWEGEFFDQRIRNTLHFIPKGAYSGFFMAKIYKT